MKTLKITAFLTFLAISSAFYCKGSAPADSITVTIKINDPVLLSKAPQLNLQRLGEEGRVRIAPVSVEKDLLRFKFVNENFFECILNFNEDSSKILLFFLSPESTEVLLECDFPVGIPHFGIVIKSSGSRADTDFRRYRDSTKQVYAAVDEQMTKEYPDYQVNYQRPDMTNERNLLLDKGKYAMMTKAIQNKSYYTPVLYWDLMQGFDSWSVDQLKTLLTLADPGEGLYYKKQIEKDLAAREAALKGESGRKVLFGNAELAEAIKSSQKKFIYLTLWASWCVPCRTHNKELLKKRFKDVEIIAVSFDELSSAMNKAVTADGIGNWKQVQLAEGFNSEIAKTFNVTALPANIVLNDKREVVGVNISDDKLLYDLK